MSTVRSEAFLCCIAGSAKPFPESRDFVFFTAQRSGKVTSVTNICLCKLPLHRNYSRLVTYDDEAAAIYNLLVLKRSNLFPFSSSTPSFTSPVSVRHSAKCECTVEICLSCGHCLHYIGLFLAEVSLLGNCTSDCVQTLISHDDAQE